MIIDLYRKAKPAFSTERLRESGDATRDSKNVARGPRPMKETHDHARRAKRTAVLLIVGPVVGYHLLKHPMIMLGGRLANRAEKRYEQHELESFRQESPVNL